uniref:Cyclin N-terminal domain-containing protein n=1 Tax=Arcella intermedia TaxID=1963864 RepID=A0A6B2LL95_9EUKA
MDQILVAVSACIVRCIHLQKPECFFDPIYDERVYRFHPFKSLKKHLTIDDIWKFLLKIQQSQNLPIEAFVLCTIYVDRLSKSSCVYLNPFNWKRILMICLMVASKMFSDFPACNGDFISTFPHLDPMGTNQLERLFLKHIDYNVYVSVSVFLLGGFSFYLCFF